MVFDSDAVLARSKNLILDPLKGHDDDIKCIDHPDMRETIKELSQLDGAFVVSDQGVVISACRYLNASSEGIDLPMGLGSRHMAAASITRDTKSTAVVVSESSVVRIFEKGILISEIIPEFWMLDYHGHHLSGPISERTDQQLTVVSSTEICNKNKKQDHQQAGRHKKATDPPPERLASDNE